VLVVRGSKLRHRKPAHEKEASTHRMRSPRQAKHRKQCSNGKRTG
jgi:hypothetical protein